MSDTPPVPPCDPPAIDNTPEHHSLIYVPPGTFAEWERLGALIERVNNPTTPADERARFWWDELAAVVTRRNGPLPRSGQLRGDGILERHAPRVVEKIRNNYARELISNLALAMVEAGLAPLVQALRGEVGGRMIVLPLLKRAIVDIAMVYPEELAADPMLDSLTSDLVNNKYRSHQTLDGLRAALLDAPATSAAPTAPRGEGGLSPPPKLPRDNRQPSQDKQNDILAAIRNARMPLTRPELVKALGMGTEGKLGANLAWMVDAGILVNVPQRGYWTVALPVPD
jgi:hypothetical protein